MSASDRLQEVRALHELELAHRAAVDAVARISAYLGLLEAPEARKSEALPKLREAVLALHRERLWFETELQAARARQSVRRKA